MRDGDGRHGEERSDDEELLGDLHGVKYTGKTGEVLW